MHNFRKSGIKPWDIIIISILVVASFVPTIVFALSFDNAEIGNSVKYAVVKIDGKEVERFDLDEISSKMVTYYPSDTQYNIVEIHEGKIRVKEDNSPDQIAVRTGWISEPGQTSICLPHRLVITIEQEGQSDYHIY
ncbi:MULTISPECIES: NusG domain II-containing protein [Enterococcus]|uniref:NusG domain II-containing protein n=1 Tax=Enterococcus TaxID=1350 RepID=UPI0003C561B9|nr:NusG domain II-containing protein [Enterococcus mundtii]MCA6774173.1 NusG domain II-containing protein [Enterococcus mundtii]QCJ56493.1 NusG domain II-containing protein [Enterococcus mundtii]BAO07068.1 cobW/P47K family protein [Enterococcus mundtii QU 25]